MQIQHLINHYAGVRQQHEPIPGSLQSKLDVIGDALGSLPAHSDGLSIVQHAKKAWPNVKPNTLLRYLGQTRAVLRAAERDGLIPKAPHIQLPTVYDVRYVDMSIVEADALLNFIEFSDPWAYPSILFLMHTGARLGEALEFDPQRDATRSGVLLRKPIARRSKTIERTIPYSCRLRVALQSTSARLFVEKRSGMRYSSTNSASACLGRVLHDACESTGFRQLRVHDLRHVFASMLAEAGADIDDIATLLGHTNVEMSMRYKGLVKNRAASFISQL